MKIFPQALFPAMLLWFPSIALAADAHVIKETIACESIGTFMVADNYRIEGDEVAAKRLISDSLRRGSCQKFKKGTHVFFHHVTTYVDGDYGSLTTVRRAGDTRSWVVEKCALDERDPDVARFPGYTPPERPCP